MSEHEMNKEQIIDKAKLVFFVVLGALLHKSAEGFTV